MVLEIDGRVWRCVLATGMIGVLANDVAAVRGQDVAVEAKAETVAGSVAAAEVVTGAVAADPYIPRDEVQGALRIAGSQTMQQMVSLWADRFQELHPGVKFELDCRGSEGALPSLTRGEASLVALSRLLSNEEKAAIERELGSTVTQVTVAWDALGVIVHPDNPIEGLSVSGGRQLSGGTEPSGEVSTWSGLGLSGEWAEIPLEVVGPGAMHGTRTWIDQILQGSVVGGRPLREAETRDEVIRRVASERGALGFVSLSHGGLETVRVLPIAGEDLRLRRPVDAEIVDRSYPLLRPLTLVTVKSSGAAEQGVTEEFLSYVLSRSGQEDVVKDGFYPLNRAEWRIQREQPGATQER